jgi:hypothetical protein
MANELALINQEVTFAAPRRARRRPIVPAAVAGRIDITQRSDSVFALEPHICRVCFGRLVSMALPGEASRIFRCTNCGAVAKGIGAKALCVCGIVTGDKGEFRDAGIRCVVNPKQTPENPSEILAKEIDR